jgi:hypothetical protein
MLELCPWDLMLSLHPPVKKRCGDGLEGRAATSDNNSREKGTELRERDSLV